MMLEFCCSYCADPYISGDNGAGSLVPRMPMSADVTPKATKGDASILSYYSDEVAPSWDTYSICGLVLVLTRLKSPPYRRAQ